MLAPGFEWFVAWRHLRDPERRSWRLLKTGVGITLVGLAAVLVLWLVTRGHHPARGAYNFGQPAVNKAFVLGIADWVAKILFGLGVFLTFLGVLFGNFTLFTAISIFGVFLGTGAPIIALSVMSGFEADLKTKIRATKADVVVQAKDDAPFSGWEAVQERILAVPGVVASMAYIESEVIIKHATNPAGMGIILRGIDPVRAPKVLDLARTLREGKVEYLSHPGDIPTEESDLFRPLPGPMEKDGKGKEEDADEEKKETRPVLPGVLLGEELYAHTLRVYLGSDVDIACPMCGVGPSGPMPKLKPFRVAGHFYTGMYEFDSKLAYVALADAQKFLGMQGEVTGIEVHTRTPDVAHTVADVLAKTLGDAYEVRSWEELNAGLFMALKLEKIAMFIVLTFILLVASFSVVSTLLMLATEKGREIAILKSMGARGTAVLKIFVLEGFYIGVLGMLLGLTTGIAGCQLLSKRGLPLDPDIYYIQKLPVVMRGTEITLICLAAVGLCCLATLYPAYLASRTRPVDGLRYD